MQVPPLEWMDLEYLYERRTCMGRKEKRKKRFHVCSWDIKNKFLNFWGNKSKFLVR